MNSYKQKSKLKSKLSFHISGHNLYLLRELLPYGRIKGSEFVCLNPTRSDRHLGSFRINTNTFKWADFATGDKGKGIISLWSYIKGISREDAILQMLEVLGENMSGF